jgi:probable biosynthetic protein (TIGR04098 family)
MKRYLHLFQEIIPALLEEDFNLPFNAIIESIDLVTIRVQCEREIGKTIPDSDWMNFQTLSDVVEYCRNQENVSFSRKANNTDRGISKQIAIDMPQMAIEALSENWLFKELGNLHWQMLCKGLNTPSFDLKDELDNRLYATFVRIQIQSTTPLNNYKENEILNVNGKIKRYGNSMYYSDILLESSESAINARLMTSFSIRNSSDNTKLVKSQPKGLENSIEEFDTNPLFGNEYRLIKKSELNEVKIGTVKFTINNDYIFETTYKINPYYDLNGVGLLYFASYPIINDVCESEYFNQTKKENIRWEVTYYTLSRDILYYGNCNINEEIIYKLHSFEFISEDTIKINSSLHRKSDNILIARIFSIKKK